MASATKQAIKDTFVKLLDERPLHRITVKDIVETCGVNRNSFYYHFEDLPSLLEEIIAEQVQEMTARHPTLDSLEECFDAVVGFVLERKRAVLHIYNSLSREVFERGLMEVCRYVAATYVDAAPARQAMDEADRAILIRYHKCECFGHIIDWLNSGMTDDVSAYFHQVYKLKHGREAAVHGGSSFVE